MMPSALPPWLEPLGHDIYAIDTGFGRARFDAAYLVVADGRAAYIDSGTALAMPRLTGALQALGLPPAAVDWIIPTHVHLDHAGAVGHLAREFAQARVLVHPRGLRHMADPAVLWQAATAVYGAAQMARDYDHVLAVPAERLLASSDGMRIHLGSRPLELIDTPGHARHHHCLWDERSAGWFTGDTFGISYREFDTEKGAFVTPAATPAQFDPAAMEQSVRRLMSRSPRHMYVTHYGRLDEVPVLAERMLAMLADMVAFARRLAHARERHQALMAAQLELFCQRLAEHGCTRSREEIERLLAVDLELNAQGMAIWLDAPQRPTQAGTSR